MADEIRNGDSKVRVVRLLGHRDDAGAWEIRDFLKRSVVEFQWIELSTEEDCRRELGLSDLKNVNLPVVELPDGTRLFGPTLRDVADRLGFVTKPKLRQYDVSIYGAGPAGLSAAVYAASEGLSTVLVERSAVGGQAGTTSMIENYMGFPQGINSAECPRSERIPPSSQVLRHRNQRVWEEPVPARLSVCPSSKHLAVGILVNQRHVKQKSAAAKTDIALAFGRPPHWPASCAAVTSRICGRGA